MTIRSIGFFDRQFAAQAAQRDYALNPFELAALPHLAGHVLDLGCGLGNLAIAAARQGCTVDALDASLAGIDDLERRARELSLPVRSVQADLARYAIPRQYDCVVAIGLLMFFPCDLAKARLEDIRNAVAPGGIAAINVLVEGTTFLAMFAREHYCLFDESELQHRFADWQIINARIDAFPAPADTLKRFATVIARKPPVDDDFPDRRPQAE